MSTRKVLLAGIAFLLVAATGAALFVRLGVYNVSATDQHTAPVFWLLQTAKKWSVRQRAAGIQSPDLTDSGMAGEGMALYHRHCVQCHGAPGISRGDLGKGLTPVPPNLVQTAREKPATDIFWVIRNGLKMTGMPAWQYRMSDRDIWAIVAFVKELPATTPADHRRRASALAAPVRPRPQASEPAMPEDAAGGDRSRGRIAIRQYACTACHTVPGIIGSDVRVGPPLRGMGSRKYIAGVLVNTPENMVRWLRDPSAVDPMTAMPDLGVTAEHARDIAAYLRSLD